MFKFKFKVEQEQVGIKLATNKFGMKVILARIAVNLLERAEDTQDSISF